MVHLSNESLRSICEGAGWSISDGHWDEGWVHAIKVLLSRAEVHGYKEGKRDGLSDGYANGFEEGRCKCG